MLKRAIRNWLERHRNPVSFWLHMAGIPACFIACPILLLGRIWWWALAAFVGGYVLQFIGHGIEGNRSGEEMLLRRLLSRGAAGEGDDEQAGDHRRGQADNR